MTPLYALVLVINTANGTQQDAVIGAYSSKALCDAHSTEFSSVT